jgi:hypothetical protein
VVPIEPIRDGMVPQLQHFNQNNAEAARPRPLTLAPVITTGSPLLAPSSGQKHGIPDPPAATQTIAYNHMNTKIVIREEDSEDSKDHVPPPSPHRVTGRRNKQNKIKQKPSKTTGRGHNVSVFEDLRKREDIIARWREKKARRTFNRPKVQYESRQRTALEKHRVNGKFVKPEIYKAYVEAQEQSTKQNLHTVPTVTPANTGGVGE